MRNINNNGDTFRDTISTISNDGKRNWIYPKKVSGKYYNARTYVSWLLLLILIATPFIKTDGHPIIQFNFFQRVFTLFGTTFGPHDFHIFVLAFIGLLVSIILFTAVFGRIFCGWMCPQTIFMEMVFRKIEYFIEGDANEQRKLNESNWNANKIIKKLSKYSVFYIISFLITCLIFSYVVGYERVYQLVTNPFEKGSTGVLAIFFTSIIIYWIFSWFREQACTILCPYGRLQSVLLDQNSLIIAYDNRRGEPRGKLTKPNNGDCIDCYMCVDVCPTGIDIRNGLQLECVNCTACIDACDKVMTKINKPKGLIKYASLNIIESNERFRFTSRLISYSLLFLIIAGIIGYLLSIRTEYNIQILRTPGMLFLEQPDNKISNVYDLNIVNKTFNNLPIDLKLNAPEGSINMLGDKLVLQSQGSFDGKFLVTLNKDKLSTMTVPIEVSVYSNGRLLTTMKTSFLGPMKE